MDIGEPVKKIVIEPLELPEPLRPEKQPVETPVKTPEKEPVHHGDE